MSRTLLVADDSATMRQVVTMAFKGSPFRVVAVGGGAEALQAAYEHRPDIILLDYHLPDRSGLEVCRAVKGDPNLKGIPVLMMGGSYHQFDEGAARASGSDDVILKPFRTDAVLEKVQNLTRHLPTAAAAQAPAAPTMPQGPRAAQPNTMLGMRSVPTPPGQAPPRPGASPAGGARYQHSVPAPPPPPARPGATPLPPPARFAGTPQRRQPPAPQPPPPLQPPTPALPPAVMAPPQVATPPAAPAATLDKTELRNLVRAEVQQAVREEMLTMVKSVLGDLFKEKMMPKLLAYGEERIETIVAADLKRVMERKVEEELARLTDD
jgi:CheY-like chemotaxis protein